MSLCTAGPGARAGANPVRGAVCVKGEGEGGEEGRVVWSGNCGAHKGDGRRSDGISDSN